jgi:thiamine pyrophosphokinase
MTTTWYPARLLEGNPVTPYGIIVLNQPINRNALDTVIDHAVMLVCADAGADRYMSYGKGRITEPRLPDAIVGDLDSISAEAEQYYKIKGVEFAEDPDQYATDFTKSLKWIRREWDQKKGSHEDLDIIVMGGLGGRVDQGFSQIHHLYMVLQQPELLRGALYLLSEQSLSFVLAEGYNELHVNDVTFTENVGIIPVLGLSHITTSGLEWDVEEWPTQFGGQVSTSNHIKLDLIKIRVDDKRPLFTVELAKSLWSADLRAL